VASRAFLLVSILLAAPALAGCTDAGADEPLRKERAEVTEVLGGIEGIVTDDAFQPVVDATVLMSERDLETRTASDGSYAFSRLIPGTYTVVVQAEGFVSASETAVVARNEVTELDFVVTHLFTEEAFRTAHELVGFLECGYGWREDVTGMNVFGLAFRAIALCAVPNSVLTDLGLGGNATNDRFLHFFRLDAPLSTVVYEMDWASNNPTGDSALRARMEIRGFANQLNATIISKAGPPPLHVIVGPEQWQELQGNFTYRCNEGDDGWCGYNFFEDGWDMQMRVFASPGCNDLAVQFCPQFQQEFTHYVSGFYNAPAPEGYSVVQGNTD